MKQIARTLLPLALVCWLASCTKHHTPAETLTAIAAAETMADQPARAAEAMDLLRALPGVANMDDGAQLRWCLAYGRAAQQARRSELLPEDRFMRLHLYCERHGSLDQRAAMGLYIGNLRLAQEQGGEAFEWYTEALVLSERSGFNGLTGDICAAIAGILKRRGMEEETREYQHKAYAYYRLERNRLGQVRALGNIAYSYANSDSLLAALQYAEQARDLAIDGTDDFTKGIAFGVLSGIYGDIGKLDQAERFALQGIELDTINPAPYYIGLSEIYMAKGQFDSAMSCLAKAKKSKSLNQYVPMTIALYRARLARMLGNEEEAAKLEESGRIMKDSIMLTVANLQLKDRREESRAAYAKGKRLKALQGMTLAGGLLLLVGLIVVMGGGILLLRRLLRPKLGDVLRLEDADALWALMDELVQLGNVLEKQEDLSDIVKVLLAEGPARDAWHSAMLQELTRGNMRRASNGRRFAQPELRFLDELDTPIETNQ